ARCSPRGPGRRGSSPTAPGRGTPRSTLESLRSSSSWSAIEAPSHPDLRRVGDSPDGRPGLGRNSFRVGLIAPQGTASGVRSGKGVQRKETNEEGSSRGENSAPSRRDRKTVVSSAATVYHVAASER